MSDVLPGGRQLTSRPGVVAQPGQAVCHFGISTGKPAERLTVSTTGGSP
ncbi:hypothetical protein BZL30_5024 [Mycobacterium kansasii]|uniref:Uncharacterized protein n=1 Tax=Mycobacterium kansasii TaxID=1768 RepID=A0A1V3X5I4_MYCKA|nr:hypothetical protein BZL30_5024 [Mycobacterium kansasii]